MTTVETTVTISISPEGKSLEALEAGIGQGPSGGRAPVALGGLPGHGGGIAGAPGRPIAPQQAAAVASAHPVWLDATDPLADARCGGRLLLPPGRGTRPPAPA